MKIYILNTGYLVTDKNNVEASEVAATSGEEIVAIEHLKLPVLSFLIDNDGEYILYDVGSNPEAMNGYWPENLQKVYPLYQREDERIENQLALCGVKPEDINTVIISHMHLDHAGNLQLFKHANIYVPKADFMHAQTQVRLNPDPMTHGGYIKADLDVPVSQYHLIEEDFLIAPGIEVINLPGHTPGLLGLVVTLAKEGTFILPQDCIYTENIFGPPAKASGLLHDTVQYFESIEKVRKIKDEHDGKVIFAHDYDFFKTLKTAPAFYE